MNEKDGKLYGFDFAEGSEGTFNNKTSRVAAVLFGGELDCDSTT